MAITTTIQDNIFIFFTEQLQKGPDRKHILSQSRITNGNLKSSNTPNEEKASVKDLTWYRDFLMQKWWLFPGFIAKITSHLYNDFNDSIVQNFLSSYF